MLKVDNLSQQTHFKAKRLPQKTITIVHKDGRDFVKDEFVGYHAVRPSMFELVKSLFEDFLTRI
jgi:hypothetical protein